MPNAKLDLLAKYDLQVFAISKHLKGQAVCDDPIDGRHKEILSPKVWGRRRSGGVRQGAAVVGFTGSVIWKYVAMFPPVSADVIAAGYQDFVDSWNPILDVFDYGAPVSLPEVDEPVETHYEPYGNDRAQTLDPVPPLPYREFEDTFR